MLGLGWNSKQFRRIRRHNNGHECSVSYIKKKKMQTVKIIAVVVWLICPTELWAQKKWLMKVDSVLRERYYGADIDTNYLQRPEQRWDIRVGNNFSSSALQLTAERDGNEYKAELDADMKMTAQVKISYSGLALALSVNPTSLKGKNNDWGLNFNTSGRRFGLDVTASISKTMKGYVNDGDIRRDVNTGDMQQKMIYATAYYAFNARRFAYAAASSLSYIQKRSAGSWLLSAAFYGTAITTERKMSSELNHLNFALGGGYGYNWVPGRHWLFHISGTPTLCLYSHSSVTVNGEYEKMKRHFPEFIIIGKGAVVYQTRKWFLGSNMIYYTSVNGEKSKLHMLNTRWYLRTFVGLRF